MYSIYFARSVNSGLIKIGRTQELWNRLRNLSNPCNGGRVELVASIDTQIFEAEQVFHWMFRNFRVEGRSREWFAISAEQVSEGLVRWERSRHSLLASYRRSIRRRRKTA